MSCIGCGASRVQITAPCSVGQPLATPRVKGSEVKEVSVPAAAARAGAQTVASPLPARPRVCAIQWRRDESGVMRAIFLAQRVGLRLIAPGLIKRSAGMGMIGVALPTLIHNPHSKDNDNGFQH